MAGETSLPGRRASRPSAGAAASAVDRSEQRRHDPGERFGQARSPEGPVTIVAHELAAPALRLDQFSQRGDQVAVPEQYGNLEVQAEAAVVEVGTSEDGEVVVAQKRLAVQHPRP